MSRKKRRLKHMEWEQSRSRDITIKRLFNSSGAQMPETVRVMECRNEFWSASAQWKRKGNDWVCVDAVGPIKWLKGMDAGRAKLELARLGCNYSWVGAPPTPVETRSE